MVDVATLASALETCLAAKDDPSVSRKMVTGAGWMIAWRFVSRVLGFGSTLILARLLLPADFGLLAMASTFSAAIDSISQLGIGDALVRRTESGLRLHNTAFTIQVSRGILTGGIIALGAPLASDWFGEPRLTAVLLFLAAGSVLASFENIGIVEYRRDMQYGMQFKLMILPRLAQVLTGIVGAIVLQSYWALLFGGLAGKIVRVIMTYVLHPFRPRLSVSAWRDLVGFSAWTWAASIARLFWDRLDSFVLGPFLGARGLGVYLIGTEMALLPVTELVEPATGILFPGFVAARNRGTDPVGLALQVISTLLLGTVPVAIAISAAAGSVVLLLLGPRWADAQPVIEIFAITCIVAPFSYVGSTLLVSGSHVRRDFQVMSVAALVKGVLLYLSVQTGEMRVIVGCNVFCTAVEALLFMVQLRAVGDLKVRQTLGSFGRIAVSGCAACLALVLTGFGWRSAPPDLLTAIVVGVQVGLVTLSIYVAVQLLVWRAMGCPEGAERRVLEIVDHFLQPVLARLRRFRGSPG